MKDRLLDKLAAVTLILIAVMILVGLVVSVIAAVQVML